LSRGAATATATYHQAVVKGTRLKRGAVVAPDLAARASEAHVGSTAAACAKAGRAAAVRASGSEATSGHGVRSLSSHHDLEDHSGGDRERRGLSAAERTGRATTLSAADELVLERVGQA
jgi:hypothetical protein